MRSSRASSAEGPVLASIRPRFEDFGRSPGVVRKRARHDPTRTVPRSRMCNLAEIAGGPDDGLSDPPHAWLPRHQSTLAQVETDVEAVATLPTLPKDRARVAGTCGMKDRAGKSCARRFHWVSPRIMRLETRALRSPPTATSRRHALPTRRLPGRTVCGAPWRAAGFPRRWRSLSQTAHVSLRLSRHGWSRRAPQGFPRPLPTGPEGLQRDALRAARPRPAAALLLVHSSGAISAPPR